LRQTIEADAALKIVAEMVMAHPLPGCPATTVSGRTDIDLPNGTASPWRAQSASRSCSGDRLLTIHREEELFRRRSISAKGYVLKGSAVTDIVAAIKAVAGQPYISPQLSAIC
jgi:hypothetical protein